MPKFVTVGGHLHQGKRPISGEGGAALGPMHDPFRLDYHPDRGIEIPHLKLLDGLTASGIDSRDRLLAEFDQLAQRVDRSAEMNRLDAFYQQAILHIERAFLNPALRDSARKAVRGGEHGCSNSYSHVGAEGGRTAR